MNDRRKELLEQDITRLFWKLSIPSILIGLVAGLYNLVDAIIVGQFIGPEAVGAVSLSYALTLPNWAITFCFGVGSATLLSRAIGAKDERTIRRLPGNIIIFCGLISTILMVILLVFTGQLLELIGGKGEILSLGKDYLSILAFGFPFISVGLGLNLLVRGEGRMMDVMIIVGITNCLNMLLDYILIEPVGMGVEGAAVATVVSQILSLALIVLYTFSGRIRTRLFLSKIRPAGDLLPEIMKVGASPMMIMLLMAIQQMVMFRILSSMGGESEIILLAATFRLFTFIPILTKGVSEGMQPLVGTSFGANDLTRSRRSFVIFTLMGTALTAAIYIPVMVFPDQVLSLFITDNAMIESGIGDFRLFFSTMILQVAIFNSLYYFLAIGNGRKGGIIAVSRQLLLFIPAVVTLPIIFGTTGLWLVIPACDVITVVMGLWMIRGEFSNQRKDKDQFYDRSTPLGAADSM